MASSPPLSGRATAASPRHASAGAFDSGAATTIVARFHSRESGSLAPSCALRGTYRDNNNRKTDQRHEQASRVEVQDQPTPRRQSLGPLEEPFESPRLRARPA